MTTLTDRHPPGAIVRERCLVCGRVQLSLYPDGCSAEAVLTECGNCYAMACVDEDADLGEGW